MVIVEDFLHVVGPKHVVSEAPVVKGVCRVVGALCFLLGLREGAAVVARGRQAPSAALALLLGRGRRVRDHVGVAAGRNTLVGHGPGARAPHRLLLKLWRVLDALHRHMLT